MTTALFYLMLSPLPDRYAFDNWVVKSKPKDPHILGFWRRVLQVHLCFVYFIGGLAKFLGNGWWDGSNLWRSLIRPSFSVIAPDTLVQFKYVLPLLGISICLLEVSYPIFIWLKRTRGIWLVWYSGNACRHRIDDGTVPLRARYDCHESGGVWRSLCERKSTVDFKRYRAIKMDIKATVFGPR